MQFTDYINTTEILFSPQVSEDFQMSLEAGVFPQDPSLKPVLVLPPKKSVAFSGDHQDTPVKKTPFLKQPPALPPKPLSRIPNHIAGKFSCNIIQKRFLYSWQPHRYYSLNEKSKQNTSKQHPSYS